MGLIEPTGSIQCHFTYRGNCIAVVKVKGLIKMTEPIGWTGQRYKAYWDRDAALQAFWRYLGAS